MIRASLGTVFTNQVLKISSDEALVWLKKKNIKIFATTPSAKREYFNSDFKEGAAIAVGTEHEGLSDFWLKQADEKISLPMQGNINSLTT